MRLSSIKFTYQDYVHIPGDRLRHEIIGGDHYVTPAPGTTHQRIVGTLFRLLDTHCIQTRIGQVFIAPTDVILSDTDVVQPDLLFIRQDRADIITSQNIQGAPDLIIEVLSPSTAERDRTIKRTTYARFGVTEYWLVSPDTKTIEVWRFQELDTAPRTFVQRDVLTSTVLPGFQVSLPAIFDDPFLG
ncbi:MAG: Uma2 family endonuclease [Nitrospiria bacterium]